MENQRTKLTKKLFKEAMIDLLEKKSLYDITVTELCQKAELNRSTFYKYYENVYDVFADIEHELILANEECLKNINDNDQDAITKPLCRLLSIVKENTKIYKLLFNNHISEEISKNIMNAPIMFFKEKLETLNKGPASDADYVFMYFFSGSLEIIKKWISSGTKETPEHIATLIYNLAAKSLGIYEDNK